MHDEVILKKIIDWPLRNTDLKNDSSHLIEMEKFDRIDKLRLKKRFQKVNVWNTLLLSYVFFPLTGVQISSLYYVSWYFTMMCSEALCILPVIHWTSWRWRLISFINSEKVWAIVSPNIASLQLFSSFGTPIKFMLVFLTVPLCLLFSSLHFFLSLCCFYISFKTCYPIN